MEIGGNGIAADGNRLDINDIVAKPSHDDDFAGLDRVLEVIDDAGYDSVDSMVTTNHTSQFPPEFALHSAQPASRNRHLRRFLNALYESAKTWDALEAQKFREGILKTRKRLSSMRCDH